jgi:hypothetical protein
MSLTLDERRWIDRREELTADERDAVKLIFEGARDYADACGINLANDDRAAHFEAALVRYVIESRA